MTMAINELSLLGKRYSMALTVAPLLCLAGIAGAQPSISNVSPTTQHRSGFVEILGSASDAPGEVAIGSRTAIRRRVS